MSRIVILMGSERKGGNTEALAGAFMEGAKEKNEVEMIRVGDINVYPCTGCECCFTSKENVCAQKDDMTWIYEKLKNADMLVIASPLYFYGISAQLKAVIDRLHNPMRNTFAIRRTALLMAGAASKEEIYDAVITQYKLTLSFFGLEDAGMVFARKVKKPGDVLNSETLKEAYALGKRIG